MIMSWSKGCPVAKRSMLKYCNLAFKQAIYRNPFSFDIHKMNKKNKYHKSHSNLKNDICLLNIFHTLQIKLCLTAQKWFILTETCVFPLKVLRFLHLAWPSITALHS